MIETLDEVNNPIVTVAMGKAMSCAAILLSHGDVRFLGTHSRVMVHEVSSGTSGNVQDMKEDIKETIRLNEYFMGLLAKNCGLKHYEELRQLIKDQDGRDRYLVGADAIKFGIVDAIGLPRISGRIMYEITKQATKAPLRSKTKKTVKTSKKSTKKSDTKKSK